MSRDEAREETGVRFHKLLIWLGTYMSRNVEVDVHFYFNSSRHGISFRTPHLWISTAESNIFLLLQ